MIKEEGGKSKGNVRKSYVNNLHENVKALENAGNVVWDDQRNRTWGTKEEIFLDV